MSSAETFTLLLAFKNSHNDEAIDGRCSRLLRHKTKNSHVDVARISEFLLELGNARLAIDHLHQVARAKVMVAELRDATNNSAFLSTQVFISDVADPDPTVFVIEVQRHAELVAGLRYPVENVWRTHKLSASKFQSLR